VLLLAKSGVDNMSGAHALAKKKTWSCKPENSWRIYEKPLRLQEPSLVVETFIWLSMSLAAHKKVTRLYCHKIRDNFYRSLLYKVRIAPLISDAYLYWGLPSSARDNPTDIYLLFLSCYTMIICEHCEHIVTISSRLLRCVL